MNGRPHTSGATGKALSVAEAAMAETGMESEHMRIGDGLVVSSTYWNMLLNSDEGSFDEDALR